MAKSQTPRSDVGKSKYIRASLLTYINYDVTNTVTPRTHVQYEFIKGALSN